MKASVFESICGFFSSSLHCTLAHDLDASARAKLEFPHIPVDTLIAIQCQEHTRRLRQTHHKLRNPRLVQHYISRYVNGEDVLSISSGCQINPCLLARILLEHLFGLPKQQISECLKDPGRLPEDRIREVSMSFSEHKSDNGKASEQIVDLSSHISLTRLQEDLYKCMDHDNAASPYIEIIRRVTGIEYETYLYKKLRELGIPFQTENALRKAGFSKTPDVKLEVPIGVQGRVVNWIDSKASFGDEYTHKHQAEQQFQRRSHCHCRMSSGTFFVNPWALPV